MTDKQKLTNESKETGLQFEFSVPHSVSVQLVSGQLANLVCFTDFLFVFLSTAFKKQGYRLIYASLFHSNGNTKKNFNNGKPFWLYCRHRVMRNHSYGLIPILFKECVHLNRVAYLNLFCSFFIGTLH